MQSKFSKPMAVLLCLIMLLSFAPDVRAAELSTVTSSVTSLHYDGTTLSTSITIQNDTGQEQKGVVILAVKDPQNDNLLVCDTLEGVKLNDGENKFGMSTAADSLPDKYEVEVYVWDTLDDMNPLSKKIFSSASDDIPDHYIPDAIEVKDIQSVSVYQLVDGEAVQCQYLDPSTAVDLNNYMVEISMRNMPTTYSGIKSCQEIDGKTSIELTREDLYVYDEANKQLTPYRISYPTRPMQSLNVLLDEIRANPSGTFTLTQDYDASDVVVERNPKDSKAGAAVWTPNFTGTIEGNGHTIYNLKVPIFNKMSGAAVKNLILRDANLSVSQLRVCGVLANIAENTAFTDVHVRGLTLYSIGNFYSSGRHSGGIVADLDGASTILDCSVTDFSMRGNGNSNSGGGLFGGIVGRMSNTSTIQNCLAQGTFNYIGNPGAANTCVGGIVGSIAGGTVDSCVAEVENLCTAKTEMGGLVGWVSSLENSHIKNSVALGNTASSYRFLGAGESMAGKDLDGLCENCFELEDSAGISNLKTEIKTVIETQIQEDAQGNVVHVEVEVEKEFPIHNGPIDTITSDERHSAAFYTEKLKLSTDHWQNKFVESTGIPYPGSHFPIDSISLPLDAGVYLPNSTVFTQMDGYQAGNLVAYSNLYKLMPYLSCADLIAKGNLLAQTNDQLSAKPVNYVLPMVDTTYQTALTTGNYATVDQIMVLFADCTSMRYALTSPALQNGIAQYNIRALDIPYAYSRYTVNESSSLTSELLQMVRSTPYEAQQAENGTSEDAAPADLVSIVGGRDINTDVYKKSVENCTVKHSEGWTSENDENRLDETYEELMAQPEKFVYGLLSSDSQYYSPENNPVILAKLETDLKTHLSRMLYAYLYIQRWYDIDLGDVNLADVMYFDNGLYNGVSGPKALADAVVDAARTARRSINTTQMYNSRLKPIYKSDTVAEFIEKNITIFEGTSDYDQWFFDFFKGPLEERRISSPDGSWTNPRAWTFVKRNQNRILPMLSFENDPVRGQDLYVVTFGNTFHFGCVSAYISDYTNPQQMEYAKKMIHEYADRWANIYDVSATFVENSYQSLAASKTRLESRDSAYNAKFGRFAGARIPCCDPKASPALLDFFAPMHVGQYANNASAWAGGNLMVMETSTSLEPSAMGVQTHENAHLSAGSYYYGGHNNRMGSEGETNGILAQFHYVTHIEDFSLNLMTTYPPTTEYVGALSCERLKGSTDNGMTRIQDFYRKYFEALYTLDIIESRALLSLDTEIQRKMLYQHSYPNEKEGEEQTAVTHRDSKWAQIENQEAYEALNIQDYTDIMKNRMNIMRDVEQNKTYVGGGNYNFSTPLSGYFWEPYNEKGRADQFTAKRMPYELLGESGWQYGFANYLSNTGADGNQGNDLGALRVAMKHTDLLQDPVVQKIEGLNLDPDTMTYEDWKLARYKTIENKIDTVKSPYFDTEALEKAYRAAFLADANRYGTFNMSPMPVLNQTEVKPYSTSIRMSMLRYLLRITDDFETGIYEPDRDVITVSTAQELIDAATNDPLANIRVVSDLDFSQITPAEGATAYIDIPQFMGRVSADETACQTLKNLSLPLFRNIMYGHVENLMFDQVNIQGIPSYSATVSRNADKGYFSNLHITNAKIKGVNVGGIV